MSTCAPENAEALAVSAYVETIRSVLFVDDQFPTFAAPGSGSEAMRARALWAACSARGWLCDVDNGSDWTTAERRRRLAACDLLVLDYHLEGLDDATRAVELVVQLAESPSPNLVVVYTAEPNLDGVLLRLAATVRGVAKDVVERELDDDSADAARVGGWSNDALLARIQGNDRWRGEARSRCHDVGQDFNHVKDALETAIELTLHREHGAPFRPERRTIESAGVVGDKRWFQSGNLFVAVVGKQPDADGEREADVLLSGLEAAVQEWNPAPLACLLARARRSGELGAFRDDRELPSKVLQTGLAWYIQSADGIEEQTRRGRFIAADLLQRRFNRSIETLGADLIRTLAAPVASMDDALVALNAFLCSEPHDRHHLRLGSVFREWPDGGHYWICVTPACDMVPRRRKDAVDPWGAALGDARYFTALRLTTGVRAPVLLEAAERGRHVVFVDATEGEPQTMIAEVFDAGKGDPNPRLEPMFAPNLARLDSEKCFTALRIVPADEEQHVKVEPTSCIVVCQLRAPFAERISHVVGGHVSRVGVDFLGRPRARPDEQVKRS